MRRARDPLILYGLMIFLRNRLVITVMSGLIDNIRINGRNINRPNYFLIKKTAIKGIKKD